jgi:hypothetical protein
LYCHSYRCRNEKSCPKGYKYKEYTGSKVRECIGATTEIFEDGYIQCPVIECYGCEKCIEMYGESISNKEKNESQNYDRIARHKRQITFFDFVKKEAI